MSEGADPTLGELGEFAVIDRLTAGRRLPATVRLGPGDDAAVLSVPDGAVVVSTDMLVENRHFRRDWSAPADIGRKAIAQNAADIEAMGARTTGFVVAFGVPHGTPGSQVTELFDGMWDEAGRAGEAAIIGGDLVASPQWVISVTVFGDLAGRPAVLRSAARPGATVAVAGELGRSAAGYALCAAGHDGWPELRRRHLVPQPPYGQGRVAADAGAQAMTDVSDGLLADLGHLAAAGEVAVELTRDGLGPDVDAVAAAAQALDADPWAWVLGGGEDHALAACFPGAVPAGWRVIGSVVEGPPGVRLDGRRWTGSAGWDSFG